MFKGIGKIIYSDAHYSYDKHPDTEIPVGEIISYGKVCNETEKYINFELAWTENPHKTIFGIVIPKGVIHGMKVENKNINKHLCKENDTVAVYWNDIFAYDEKYNGSHKTTPMLTEGILFKETDSYLLISNPETLNLLDAINHPEKKPLLYYIPKSMIDELKCVKRYE